MHSSRSLLFALLPAVAVGQTFIVDAANGPGTNYTSIAAAVLAVPDGATLFVQPGTYSEFRIDAKGLTILGGPGVEVTRSYPSEFAIELVNTGVGQAVTISGITAATDCQLLRAANCAGPLHLEDLTGHWRCWPLSPWFVSPFPPGLELQDCAQVMLRAVDFPNAGIYAVDSNLVLDQCVVTAPDGSNAGHGTTLVPSPALFVQSGSAVVTRSVLVGGDGVTTLSVWADAPAISVDGSNVRAQGGSTLQSGDWGSGPATSPAIDGVGTLRLDLSVMLSASSATLIGTGMSTTLAPLADVRGASAPPGGVLMAEALQPVGQFAVLIVGFPGPALLISGIADPFWVASQDHAFIAMGTPQQGAPLTATVSVPNQAGLRGLVLAWQSVTVGATGLEASNPSWTLVR